MKTKWDTISHPLEWLKFLKGCQCQILVSMWSNWNLPTFLVVFKRRIHFENRFRKSSETGPYTDPHWPGKASGAATGEQQEVVRGPEAPRTRPGWRGPATHKALQLHRALFSENAASGRRPKSPPKSPPCCARRDTWCASESKLPASLPNPALVNPSPEPFRPTLVSRSLSHPLPDPILAGGRGRKSLIFFLTKGKGKCHFWRFGHTKKAAEWSAVSDRKSRLARRLRGTGVGAADRHVRGGAVGPAA